jgi:hypothetical protein
MHTIENDAWELALRAFAHQIIQVGRTADLQACLMLLQSCESVYARCVLGVSE